MSAFNSRAVFERFINAANARDADALDDLLHPDFQDFYPQSGERTRGAENAKAILANYPGGFEGAGTSRVVGAQDRWVATPSFTLLRIEGTGNQFTAVQKARYPDGSDWYVVVIAEIKDGKVWRVESFFAPVFDPPEWRSAWVDVEDRP